MIDCATAAGIPLRWKQAFLQLPLRKSSVMHWHAMLRVLVDRPLLNTELC